MTDADNKIAVELDAAALSDCRVEPVSMIFNLYNESEDWRGAYVYHFRTMTALARIHRVDHRPLEPTFRRILLEKIEAHIKGAKQ